MNVLRKHDKNVFVVLTGKHGVLPVNLAGKKRHAFVLYRGAVERIEFEMDEVRRLQQLRQSNLAVVRGVSRVVGEAAIVVLKMHEARVFDAVALAGGGREEH